MKRNVLLFSFALLSVGSYAQLTIQSGATFFIQSGATVTVQGDITSNADIQGPGILLMKGSALQTVNMNGFAISPAVQIDNGSNVALGGAATLNTSLSFTTGKVQLNGFDLNLAPATTLSGFDNTKYFITNSTGRLVKNSLGAVPFIYPVGFDGATYNPVTITQNGAVDNLGVRCLQNVLNGGTAGSPFVKEVVDASWAVTEAVVGGSNLAMTSSWNAGDEMTGFNRTKTGISYYDGVGWDMTNATTGAAAGAGPYTITRSSVTNLANGGIFAVGTRPVLITLQASPKIFLHGAYAGAGLMNDGLRVAGTIPTSEPYTTTSNFTHSGSGGVETIPSSILSGTSSGVDIVDWVFAQLHRSSDGAVIATRSVLVQRNGFVVDVDGTNAKINYINFAGEPAGSYYVSIRHRNHLGVRTPGLLALSRTASTSHDFTTALTQAYNGGITNDPMVTLAGGVFGLWGGNANSNSFVSYSNPANDNTYLLNTVLGGNKANFSVNGYNTADLNLNNQVRYSNPGNDNTFLLNTVLGGDKTKRINQAIF